MDRGEVELAVQTAYDFGRRHIDLSGCYFGKPFGKGPFIDWPLNYYYFLAGLVARLKCTRILEIGAHFGGSIFSMARGIQCAGLVSSAEIVTVDVINRNPDGFKAVPLVKHILGSCLDPTKVRAAAESFSGPVDLLFVDFVHTYEQTKRCLDCYIPAVSPRLIILDDIRLNESMARLWDELKASHGDRAIDVTHWARQEEAVGFGLLINEALTASPTA